MDGTYFFRWFNAEGGLLRFEMCQCADDASAMKRAMGEMLPVGCMSVEVTREDHPIWRGPAAELGLALH